MKWFQRKPEKQISPQEPLATSQTPTKSEELYLLLLRPSISKIFENPSDKIPINADSIMTSFGMYSSQGMPKHALERIPILCVTENGSVGYTTPMRLDLFLCLHQLAKSATPPIDFPLGLFENRDVLVITKGLYYVRLFHNAVNAAMQNFKDGADEFLASKIIYSSTTIDEGAMTNLRRLEATAKHLLTPEPSTPPKLPPNIIDGWQHDFLEPLFTRVKEKIQ